MGLFIFLFSTGMIFVGIAGIKCIPERKNIFISPYNIYLSQISTDCIAIRPVSQIGTDKIISVIICAFKSVFICVLKIQSAFSRRVRQRLYPAMIHITGPVKYDFYNALFFTLFGQGRA